LFLSKFNTPKMKKVLFPTIIAVTLVCGILIGEFYATWQNKQQGLQFLQQRSTNNKLSDLLYLIDNAYVDSIDMDSITDVSMATLVTQLDPHSAYIPAKDIEAVNEQLEGSFSGIGVQFNLQNDTIYIVDVISGGPSEKAGILPDDRIISVDDSAFVGKNINNEKVMKTLRGKKGTTVKLGIVRRSAQKTLYFDITRDDIPVKSIDVAYMIAPKTGYIAVNKFGETTYQEFLTALAQLRQNQASQLIIDLRGNAGGYMDAAINMLNEFLPKGALIVYLEGKAYEKTSSFANGTGAFQNTKIAVLIDEFSGSASEIFAGAIQDNDRGTIIGRRSFGKGLVQQQFDFADKSAVRLTIARYYTPSGRCIQKPYIKGDSENYEIDIWKRFMHGEFFSEDSIKQNDAVTYKTVGGRPVFSGGGIMPDIFVARDTIGDTPYFHDLVNKNCIYKFALNYTEANRATLSAYKNWEALEKHLIEQNLFQQVVNFGAKQGVKDSPSKNKSRTLIERQVNAYIIRNILNDDGFFPVLNKYDNTVKKAIEVLNQK